MRDMLVGGGNEGLSRQPWFTARRSLVADIWCRLLR